MHFPVGSLVVHPAYGMGKVVGIEMIEYMGAKARPYYNVLLENGNIWMPAEPSEAVNIRPVTTNTELDQYRKILSGKPEPLQDDRHKRNSENRMRLKQADFQILCEVLRDLTAYGWEKKLNDYDTTTLRKVTTSLVQEWSISAGITLDDAQNEIKALLLIGKETYSG
jgi:RNA polymerase-interacting CarD/CdnL/TRCF family regulator